MELAIRIALLTIMVITLLLWIAGVNYAKFAWFAAAGVFVLYTFYSMIKKLSLAFSK